jgi:hypothetical protein
MLETWQHRLLTVLSGLSLVLVLVNGALFLTNRASQAEITARQQFIQQTVQLEGLYREIVKALAELAVKNGDNQIIQMLAAQGISVSNNSPVASAAASGARK